MSDTPESVSAMLKGGNDPNLEHRLQRKRDMAVVGALMGIPPTLAMSKILMEDVDQQRSRATRGGRRYLGNGFIMDEDGNVSRDEGMAAAELEREARLLSRMGYQNELITNRPPGSKIIETGGGYAIADPNKQGGIDIGPTTDTPKPIPQVPPSQAGEARSWQQLDVDIGNTAVKVRATPGIANKWKKFATDTAGMAPATYQNTVRNWIAQGVYTQAELAALQELDFSFNRFLSEISGKASTPQEMANVQRWTASAGQGPEQMMTALTQMQKFARDKAQALGDPYGRNPQPQYPAPSQDSGTVEWERGPDGRPRRKQR